MTANPPQLPVLAIIVPCYNEEEVLRKSANSLLAVLNDRINHRFIAENSFICFVNDGSHDTTWNIISSLIQQNKCYRGICLSRNFGHQAALLAGLFTAEADIYVSIDADLQDDEQAITEMVNAYRNGADIVYGCRSDRTTDSFFKRKTAELFYRLRNAIGCHTIPNHADYRLMSRRAVQTLKQYSEANLYLRGIIPMLGFPSAKVFYARKAREAGESKYPLHKMLKLAWNGVVNFTEAPLRIIIILGLVGFFLSILLIAYVLYALASGSAAPNDILTISVISLFGSIQLLGIGCIGLYIGKILNETKRRPHYIIQEDLSTTGPASESPRN